MTNNPEQGKDFLDLFDKNHRNKFMWSVPEDTDFQMEIQSLGGCGELPRKHKA